MACKSEDKPSGLGGVSLKTSPHGQETSPASPARGRSQGKFLWGVSIQPCQMTCVVPNCHVPLRNAKGEVVASSIVDWEDYDAVMCHKWHVDLGYARSSFGRLSHFIAGKPEGDDVVDHINRDKLDDRRKNLRQASRKQNNQNKRKRSEVSNGTKYVGVFWRQEMRKWTSQCGQLYLGSYTEEEDAARAYDEAALHIFGAGAMTNGIGREARLPEKKIRLLPKNVYSCGNNYQARIIVAGKVRHLGTFVSEQEAEAAVAKGRQAIQANVFETHSAKPIERDVNGHAIIKVSSRTSGACYNIICDDEDWHRLSMMSWCVAGGYAVATIARKSVAMHQLLLPSVARVDHLNWNKLDNRKKNLRAATRSENGQNVPLRPGKEYRGVYASKQRWAARIVKDKIKYHLGSFATIQEAAKAYDIKAKELYDLPALNFPDL